MKCLLLFNVNGSIMLRIIPIINAIIAAMAKPAINFRFRELSLTEINLKGGLEHVRKVMDYFADNGSLEFGSGDRKSILLTADADDHELRSDRMIGCGAVGATRAR